LPEDIGNDESDYSLHQSFKEYAEHESGDITSGSAAGLQSW